MPPRRPRSTLALLSLVALIGGPWACAWQNRGGPTGIFLDATFQLGPPVVSYGISDPDTDCTAGEGEKDALVTWARQQFTPSFASVISQSKLSACRPPGKKRHFIAGPPTTILENGDTIGACTWDTVFEFAQVGSHTVAVGQCVGGDHAVVVGEWTAGSVSFELAFRTGLSFADSSSFQTATGFDAVSDGLNLTIGLTYRDDQDRFGLALCTDPGTGWGCQRLALASELGQAYLTGPKLGLDCPGATRPGQGCPSPAGIDACVLSSDALFGQPTALWRLPATPTPGTPTQVIAVGDSVGMGETLASFGIGGFVDHAAGNQLGAFVGTTSPSGISALWTYGAGGVDSPPFFQTGDPIPDTLETAVSVGRPSIRRDRISLRAFGSLGRFTYLTQARDAQDDPRLVGFARGGVDMWGDREIASLTGSNHAVSHGTAVLGLDLTSGAGSQTGVAAYDVRRVEVVRGGATIIYGSNATAGVINILTADGFAVDGPFDPGPDFQGAGFDGANLWFLEGDGDLHDWDFGLQTSSFLGSTGISGATGLGFDGAGSLFGATATDLYQIDTSTYGATMIGSFEDDVGTPVTNISGLSGREGVLGAVGEDGIAYEVDAATAVLTPRVMVSGLPSAVRSFTSDGERYFGGLDDGRVVEAVDWSAHDAGGSSARVVASGPMMPPAIGFGVVGDPGNGPVTALAIMAPEPAAAAAAAAALLTLAGLARRRPGGPS